jgi:hypothetical protein
MAVTVVSLRTLLEEYTINDEQLKSAHAKIAQLGSKTDVASSYRQKLLLQRVIECEAYQLTIKLLLGLTPQSVLDRCPTPNLAIDLIPISIAKSCLLNMLAS